jgi:hypothetical protein
LECEYTRFVHFRSQAEHVVESYMSAPLSDLSFSIGALAASLNVENALANTALEESSANPTTPATRPAGRSCRATFGRG